MKTLNRQWLLVRTPVGKLSVEDFELLEVPQPPLADGGVLCRVLWISIDAAARAWMWGASYRGSVDPGDVMEGYGIGQVVLSTSPSFIPGDIVSGDFGWQEYALMPHEDIELVDVRADLAKHLSVLNVTGLAAYFGLIDIGQAQPGETVLVSAAAGATGNLVGQIARRIGCRVVGITSSTAKQRWLVDELGFDAVVNHRSPTLRADLKSACTAGVDVYFDNVGGPLLDLALSRMNNRGRIVCCGMVAQYDSEALPTGPRGVPSLLTTKRLRMEGFIVFDYASRYKEGLDILDAWLQDGSLVATEDVLQGIERAPEGLVGLLAGDNVGKRLIHVADAAPIEAADFDHVR